MSAAMKSQWFVIENETNHLLSSMNSQIVFCIHFALISKRLQGLVWGWVIFVIVPACQTVKEEVRLPAQEIYHKALIDYEDNALKEAQVNFEKVIEQNPAIRLTTISYLKLGDLQLATAEWDKAETNYRTFLTLSPNSHLVPYVLSQLIAVNYQRNREGIFLENRDFERDMEPNRKIIQEYQRFFFLYANNAYLLDVTEFLHGARNDLAEHEFSVGNFYFENKAFDSAILRYLYLLKTYSDYPRTKAVGLRLVEAYEANQQPHLAEEMKKAIEVRFSQDNSP